jgi:hydrogenase nickel insertion protein HypA
VHEIAYCEALLTVVDERAKGAAVTAVGVRAGARHGLVDVALAFAWEQVAADTPYANAEVVLTESPFDARCAACGHRFTTCDTLPICERCGDVSVQLSGGDDFALEWLTYLDRAEAETQPTDVEVAASVADHVRDHHVHTHEPAPPRIHRMDV